MQDLLEEMGCTLREYAWPDYWYFGKEHRMMGSAEKASAIDTSLFETSTETRGCTVPVAITGQREGYSESPSNHSVVQYLSVHVKPCLPRMRFQLEVGMDYNHWRSHKRSCLT